MKLSKWTRQELRQGITRYTQLIEMNRKQGRTDQPWLLDNKKKLQAELERRRDKKA